VEALADTPEAVPCSGCGRFTLTEDVVAGNRCVACAPAGTLTGQGGGPRTSAGSATEE